MDDHDVRVGATGLRDARERFDLLVDAVDEYAIYMLDPDGVVASWNAGAIRLKGYTADEIVGRHVSVFYAPDDVAAGRPQRNLADAVARGRTHDEGWRVRKDGTQFWANVTITAMRDDDGALRGFAKVTRDETDRMMAEQHLRDLELLQERERIATELRERLVHQLFEGSLLIEGVLRLVHDPFVRDRLVEAVNHLDATIKEIRATVLDLAGDDDK
jgi:PAS domain S-box-containing protein